MILIGLSESHKNFLKSQVLLRVVLVSAISYVIWLICPNIYGNLTLLLIINCVYGLLVTIFHLLLIEIHYIRYHNGLQSNQMQEAYFPLVNIKFVKIVMIKF